MARRRRKGDARAQGRRRADDLQSPRTGPWPRPDRGRQRYEHVSYRTRPPLLRDARRPLRREHDLRKERPSPPPPERVANDGPEEGGAALLPNRIRRAYPRPVRPQVRPLRPRSNLHPPEYLRQGADRGVRSCLGVTGPYARRALPHRSTLRERLRYQPVSWSACQVVSMSARSGFVALNNSARSCASESRNADKRPTRRVLNC